MTPEQLKQFNDMQVQLSKLETVLLNLAEIDPQMRRTIEKIMGSESGLDVTDYDQDVAEGGSSSYSVPAQFDGLTKVDGKLFGYYNPL